MMKSVGRWQSTLVSILLSFSFAGTGIASEEGAESSGLGPGFVSVPIPCSYAAAKKIDSRVLFALAQPQKSSGTLEALGRQIVILGESPSDLTFPVLIRSGLTDAELALLGAPPDSRVEKIVTARVRASDLPAVAEHPLVEAIEASYWLLPDLDVSIPDVRADLINQGSPPSGYTGSGVIYGLMDDGIDITHDDFKDAGGGSRILYIWDHWRDGSAPSGFSYGYEYTKSMIDGGQATQFVNEGGHGSHVAGISVGDGSSLPSQKYQGVAWEADIIHVRNNYCDLFCYGGGMPPYEPTDSKGSIDGLNWMLQKAVALGKPLVVNQSQGTMMGPHDGTTLLEAAYNDLVTNNNLIICIAAGNDEDSDWHGKITVSGSGQGQFVLNHDTSQQGSSYIYWDCWYESGKTFNWQLVNPSGGTISIDANSPTDQYPVQYFTAGQADTVWYWASTNSPVNGQGYANMWVQNRRLGVAGGNWTVRAINQGGSSGVVDLYCERNQYTLKVTSGLYTDEIVGMPGTCTNAITVASYNTKLEWDAIDGSHYTATGENPLGDISSFSSWGPRRDGEQKPDIAAPGAWIMSVWADGNQVSEAQVDPEGQHKIISGTSMATPHVSGAIALMLQKDPTLTPSQIKSILQSTARTDAYTGSVWNKKWGYGKLDVKAAVDAVGGDTGECATTMGDANGDEDVNVLDIVAVVNHILGTNPLDTGAQACANVNGDESINVLDLVGIVNIILQGKSPVPIAESEGDSPSVVAWGQEIDRESFRFLVDGCDLAGAEMMFILPRGFELAAEPALRGSTGGSQIVRSERVGQHTLLAYNPTGGALGRKGEPLAIEIPVARTWDGGQTLEDLSVTRVVLSDRGGRPLALAGEPTLGERSADPGGGLRSLLSRMSPNPMRDLTQLSYRLERSGPVLVIVYDAAGRKVRSLWEGWQLAGGHTLNWDGRNDQGGDVGPGVFFVRLETADAGDSRKLTVIR